MDKREKQRDRSRTADTILEAAKTVLAEQGFAGWGVNAIARAAGCDKQLIYRYHEGLDGLAEAIGAEMAAWLEEALAAPEGTPATSYAELMTRLALAYLGALRANRLAQRILAWEVAEESLLVKRFAAARGRAMMAWIARERGDLVPPPGVDAPAANAVLIAGVQNLVLAGAASGAFMGVALDDAGWERICAAVRSLASGIYG
ncbi:TetR/AcrR family transcriptional regulator [Sphingomonas soli]|uniref:TetR/AcrR family transcriptional regulator n=1 Tax=Sphingomonas soli TaxID=266127 RepID=UPI00083110BC|nr:TetR/AcrR family transcriptional regulator [Sphingomonas soli]